MHHVLAAHQFDLSELRTILDQAAEMEAVLENGGTDMARGKILAALFYEPSTRTRLSFETAMHRLGGAVDKRKFCWSVPRKTHFGMSQRRVDENWADN